MPTLDRLGIGWEVSNRFGWGILGLHLSFQIVRRQAARPVLLCGRDPLLSLHPSRMQLLEQCEFLDARTLDPSVPAGFPIVHSLNGSLVSTLPIRGTRNYGMIFFERIPDAPAVAHAREFDRIIAGSTWNGAVLKRLGCENVDVRFQGVDEVLFHPGPRQGAFGDRFVVFSGGKLEARKAQDLVVAAFAQFHERHPDSMLMSAWHSPWPECARELATSPYLKSPPAISPERKLLLENWVEAHGIPRSAFVDLGYRPNVEMATFLREADVALFPNRCEGGTNLVAMEALASGVPTILSANTGHLDLTESIDCLSLREQQRVDPTVAGAPRESIDGWGESSIDEILEHLEFCYSNREEAHRIGAGAARKMREWSWPKRADQIIDVFVNSRFQSA